MGRWLQAGNELLGIVVLRFRFPVNVWAGLLMLWNLGAVLFLDTTYGVVALLAMLVAVQVMTAIYVKLGFVRLLGAGHVVWIPMLPWFALNLPDRGPLYWWMVGLIAINSLSLVIDTVDVIRYLRGERAPHYRWRLEQTSPES